MLAHFQLLDHSTISITTIKNSGGTTASPNNFIARPKVHLCYRSRKSIYSWTDIENLFFERIFVYPRILNQHVMNKEVIISIY